MSCDHFCLPLIRENHGSVSRVPGKGHRMPWGGDGLIQVVRELRMWCKPQPPLEASASFLLFILHKLQSFCKYTALCHSHTPPPSLTCTAPFFTPIHTMSSLSLPTHTVPSLAHSVCRESVCRLSRVVSKELSAISCQSQNWVTQNRVI